MAKKKKDLLLESILDITTILTDEVHSAGNTVEFKEKLAFANFLRQLRLDGLKHEPEEEISGLDKLRRKLDGHFKDRGDSASASPSEKEGNKDVTS